MWVIKRANADYYYSHYDSKSDLPVYTREIRKAQLFPTKKTSKNQYEIWRYNR